jgi:type VII secretion protein EccB
MQSRRDHLQAYQFSVGRLVRAVAAGDAGAGEAPFRRSNLGVIVGTALAVLLSGGAVVYGLISPAASSAWRNPGAVIVEKETGTRYLYLGGELRPTANYASALLAAGQKPSVQYVGRDTLHGIAVGATIGIPGAPEELPPVAALSPGTWALCLRADGGTVLDLAPAGRTGPAPAAQRILVASTDRSNPAEYLVWNSVKFPLTAPSVLPALGLGNQQPIPAAAAWLAALPTGNPVVPAQVARAGKPGPAVDGRPAVVGALFATNAGGAQQYYVLKSDGLAPITRTEVALFTVAGAPAPAQVDPAVIAAVPASADRSLLSRLPDLLSGPVFDAGASLCALQSSPGAASGTRLVTEQAETIAADPPVVVPPGGGMLVKPPGQNPNSTVIEFLITDTGEKYLIGGDGAQGALGYSGLTANVVPSGVLDLVPDGPALYVSAAKQAVTWPSG